MVLQCFSALLFLCLWLKFWCGSRNETAGKDRILNEKVLEALLDLNPILMYSYTDVLYVTRELEDIFTCGVADRSRGCKFPSSSSVILLLEPISAQWLHHASCPCYSNQLIHKCMMNPKILWFKSQFFSAWMNLVVFYLSIHFTPRAQKRDCTMHHHATAENGLTNPIVITKSLVIMPYTFSSSFLL